MKAIIIAMLAILFSVLSLPAAEFSGWFSLDKRYLFRKGQSPRIIDLYNTFRGEYRNNINDRLFFMGSLDLRYYDQSRISQFSDLSSIQNLAPVDVNLWEAYVEINGFLTPNLDLRIGKQRINWGSADRLNQIDNINPDDFTDPLNFGAKVPTTAIKATYYIGNNSLELIFQPEMAPAWLPRGDYGNLFQFNNLNLEPPAGVTFLTDEIKVTLPDRTFNNSISAIKFNGYALGFDYSLSYYRGFEDIPVISDISITELEVSGSQLMAHTALQLQYPTLNVSGLDLAGEFLGLGIWAETGLFFPPKQQIILKGIGADQVLKEYDDKPYLKYTLGFDYTFRKLGYINFQWMHGFFTEQRTERFHDYLFASWEKSWFNDQLKFTLGAVYESTDLSKTSSKSGLAGFPELQVNFVDGLELAVGTFLLQGDDATLLGSWRDFDQGYIRMKVSF